MGFPFCILYSNTDSAREIPGVAKDISVDGAKIVLDSSIDIFPGSAISLSILLPETALNISGKVVWERNVGKKKEIGVCFESISKQSQEDIHHYIFKYIKQEEDIPRRA
ncbi:MAG: PilZ domain-containing protein [Candidatus Omnitrophota bacterium]|nr:MAG: PilZ domain-containing protein [Candidatus Omnitrophota bacterium]